MSMEFCNRFVAITPSATNLSKEDAAHVGIYVGVAGDVEAVMPDDTAVVFKAVPAGVILPIRVKRINNTLTTATNLLALRQI